MGVSPDSVESHCTFADRIDLPFPVLSDQGNRVRETYGVPRSLLGLLPGRVTFLIGRDRVVQHVYRSQFSVRRHARVARRALTELQPA